MISPSTSTKGVSAPLRKAHRWYYVAVGTAVITAALGGFGPGLVHSAGRLGPVSSLVAVHGVVSLAWLLLFAAQAALIATARTGLHRQLGLAAIGLALVMLPLGYATAIEAARRGFDLSGVLNIKPDPLGFLVFPLGDLASFATLFTLGLWNRRRPELHKRLMLLATLGAMMPAILNHLLGSAQVGLFVALLAAVFLGPAVYDKVRLGYFHPVTLWGGVLLFAWGNVRATLIGPSAAWHRFAGWLIR